MRLCIRHVQVSELASVVALCSRPPKPGSSHGLAPTETQSLEQHSYRRVSRLRVHRVEDAYQRGSLLQDIGATGILVAAVVTGGGMLDRTGAAEWITSQFHALRANETPVAARYSSI
jgi:hypothetical protein